MFTSRISALIVGAMLVGACSSSDSGSGGGGGGGGTSSGSGAGSGGGSNRGNSGGGAGSVGGGVGGGPRFRLGLEPVQGLRFRLHGRRRLQLRAGVHLRCWGQLRRRIE